MKASVHLLTGCVALGLTLPTNLSQAAAPLAGSFAVATAATGQFGLGKSETRREADELLKRARQAVKDGKFDQANDLIAEADKLGVKYSPLTDRWADTPEKLRKLVADQQAKASKPSSRYPSMTAKADKNGKNESTTTVPASPFSQQNQEAAMSRITDDSKAKALSFANQGRQALARGDVPGAKAFYQRSIAHQATFEANEYSPQKLGADLAKLGVEISALRPASTQPSIYNQTPEDAVAGPADRISSLGGTRLPAGEEVQNPFSLPADENPLAGPGPGAESAASAPASARRGNFPVRRASGSVSDDLPDSYPVAQGAYNPDKDNSRNAPAGYSSQEEAPSRLVPAGPAGPVSPGVALYQEGIKALENRDRVTALAKFNQAWKYQGQLDPETRQLLRGKLQDMSTPVARSAPAGGEGAPSPLEQVNSQQEVLRQKLVREITTEQRAAEKLAATDPKGALANLKKVREKITGAEVDASGKKQLLTLVDRSINELAHWIEQNKATLENDEHNTQVRSEVARDREATIEMQNKLAQLVESFNKLIDERRYAEAEIIAKQANEIAPENPVTVLLVEKSKFAKQVAFNEDNRAAKQAGFVDAMNGLDKAAEPWNDAEPIKYDVTKWEQISKMRRKMLGDLRKMSPQEMEIHRALSKQVEVKFEGQTLSQVIDTLSKMTGVNIHLNQNALHSEGITSDTPVSLNLTQPVSLKSALTLILEPMQLGYVVRNEVLDVVSKNSKDANTYAQVYYVADLVIPIPNFIPSYNMGLPGALKESLNSLGYGGGRMLANSGGNVPLGLAANEQQNPSGQPVHPLVLAQGVGAGNTAGNGQGGGRGAVPIGGPGGMGGGVIADFDSLIDLITTTIDPDTWEDVGGPGSIAEFATNLSLVISQTQEVHEKIDRLLAQLREIQDEQVTIECRFITLSDRFFERIGIDFDFNIDDNTGLNAITDILIPTRPASGLDDGGPSVAFGLTPNGTPTPTLDLEFKQGSFGSTRPQFGSFDPNTAATFGFAILSDIEAFFLLEAAQGDDRTNVLQAPKVTLFNGQTAFVSDTSQRPFVISVIPVVGDFAAAHQPVIVVLNEGTSLSVQAVISNDRRFCRLTLVPFFSKIGDVDTFTFNGSVTTNTGTTVQDPTDAKKTVTQGASRTVQGTTVQLPTFAFTSVITTVSVPDGGTVLLGGIKRLREGRNERGVPMFSKIPYISRLFRNVGIGRDAQSLMMMVTPRIIIQKEEEAKLGLSNETN